MKQIIKDETPSFWIEYVKKHKIKNYDDVDPSTKSELKQHMLKVQKYICSYCCSVIDMNNSHNEHIKPKAGHRYPKLSMDYQNMLVSCTVQGSESICGMHKGDEYNENMFVSPLLPDCDTHFRFEYDGRITGITEEGRYTVSLLNLNAYRLVESRKALIDELEKCRDIGSEYIREYYIEEQGGKLPRFVDMTEFFMNQGYFE